MVRNWRGWLSLMNAIIVQAEEDVFTTAKRNEKDRNDAVCFLESEWCSALNDMINLMLNRNNDESTLKEIRTLL
jgi:hypothetical protein